jgi:phage gpG-like protein
MEIRVQGADELSKAITHLVDYVERPYRTLKQASVMMHTDVMDHFRKELGPDGNWVRFLNRKGQRVSERQSYYKGVKRGGTKLLQDTGRLRASLSEISDNTSAVVGTNLIYAPTHQYGDPHRNIVERPFCWLSEQMAKRILDVFVADMGNLS